MDEIVQRLMQIFMPRALARVEEIRKRSGRFVHYTSAENALKILASAEVWTRNVRGMVDYMEVEHEFHLLSTFFAVPEQEKAFVDALSLSQEGVAEEALQLFNGWLPEIRQNSFITCLSEHSETEDELGRLSMWRATEHRSPRVALVVNNGPFMSTADVLKAYSSPVSYLTTPEFHRELLEIVEAIRTSADFLRTVPRERLLSQVFNMLLFACTCSKHPGFIEEREWRVLYVPRQHQSKIVTEAVETVGGVPQVVCKIPLKDVPAEGLTGLEIPTSLNRLIIGPSTYPGLLYQAFLRALSSAGVANPESKIVVSNIPLRS